MTIHQSLIVALDVLKMNVQDLSDALSKHAEETTELNLEPHPEGILISSEIDAAIPAPSCDVQIAEPTCGQPCLPAEYQKLIDDMLPGVGPISQRGKGSSPIVLAMDFSGLSEQLRNCLLFLDAVSARRQMLERLTSTIASRFVDLSKTSGRLTVEQLAQIEGLHTTTVAHALRGKLCRTPAGDFPYSTWISNLRS